MHFLLINFNNGAAIPLPYDVTIEQRRSKNSNKIFSKSKKYKSRDRGRWLFRKSKQMTCPVRVRHLSLFCCGPNANLQPRDLGHVTGFLILWFAPGPLNTEKFYMMNCVWEIGKVYIKFWLKCTTSAKIFLFCTTNISYLFKIWLKCTIKTIELKCNMYDHSFNNYHRYLYPVFSCFS